MRAMLLPAPHHALERVSRELAVPGTGEVLLRVAACAVCRTDLHVVDGELAHSRYPVVPGHEIVGYVECLGDGVTDLEVGDRVGVPWLGWACGICEWCTSDRENLCPRARFTGSDIDGGYADHTVAASRFCLRLPAYLDDVTAAPLLCAGLIGFRAYRMAGPGRRIGLYGFGAAAHLIAQVAVSDNREVYAFTRDGDEEGQQFARELGAAWAGSSDQQPPAALDAAIIFAPVGALVPVALRAVSPGATVVCAGIHMSDIPSFPYDILWGERVVRSVANLTRRDGEEFMARAAGLALHPIVERYALEDANNALQALRDGRVRGAAVLVP